MRTGYNTCLIPLLGFESSIAIARIAFLRVGKLLPPASCFDVGLADKEMTYTSLTGAAQQKTLTENKLGAIPQQRIARPR